MRSTTSVTQAFGATGLLIAAGLAALLLVGTLPAAHAAGSTIKVPDDHSTIQGAINAASDGDTILVAKGTYTETITVTNPGGGQTKVDSTAGEMVTFTNPTGTLTIHAGDTGVNAIDVGDLADNYPADIVIDGDDGGDTVNLNGAITFAVDKSLTVNAKTINMPNSDSDIAISGTGSINLTATHDIFLDSGSCLTTVDGGISRDSLTRRTEPCDPSTQLSRGVLSGCCNSGGTLRGLEDRGTTLDVALRVLLEEVTRARETLAHTLQNRNLVAVR